MPLTFEILFSSATRAPPPLVVQAKVPIVGVALTAGEAAFDFDNCLDTSETLPRHSLGEAAFDFDGAGLFLEGLESTLDAANPGSSAVLTKAGVRLADASRVLASTVPHVISIALNQGASRNVLNATLADIVEACRAAKPLAPAEPPARGEFSGRRTPPGHEPPLAARLEAASTLQRFFLRLRLARCSPEEAERTGLQRGDAAPDADPAARRTL